MSDAAVTAPAAQLRAGMKLEGRVAGPTRSPAWSTSSPPTPRPTSPARCGPSTEAWTCEQRRPSAATASAAECIPHVVGGGRVRHGDADDLVGVLGALVHDDGGIDAEDGGSAGAAADQPDRSGLERGHVSREKPHPHKGRHPVCRRRALGLASLRSSAEIRQSRRRSRVPFRCSLQRVRRRRAQVVWNRRPLACQTRRRLASSLSARSTRPDPGGADLHRRPRQACETGVSTGFAGSHPYP
jgi:hypothetical protein